MAKPTKKLTDQVTDLEINEFENALLRSVEQANCGEERVTTPEQILSLRRGRPVGSVKLAPKVPTYHNPV